MENPLEQSFEKPLIYFSPVKRQTREIVTKTMMKKKGRKGKLILKKWGEKEAGSVIYFQIWLKIY